MNGPRPSRILAALALTALLAGTSACGTSSGGTSGGSSNRRELTVLAASSLTKPFGMVGGLFQAAHPGTKVTFVFDSSATLVDQLADGSPGDVLATADQQTMDKATGQKLISGHPTRFATNEMVLGVPQGSHKVTSLADLTKSGTTFLTCVPTAPCGALAQHLLTRDGIKAHPASQETSDSAVVQKVESGEVDAGLMYLSDIVSSAGKLDRVDVPGAAGDLNPYLIAQTSSAKDTADAKAWLKLVASPRAQEILAKAGFGKP